MKEVFENLDQRVESMLAAWGLPGVALGIVKDGEVVFSKGFGKANVESDKNMQADTMLPIGSITKTFTSLAIAMLVDEGKVDLDTPIIEYVPDLELATEELTKNVTLRDLLSHQTGLPGYDVHGVFCTLDDREAMVKVLKGLQPTAPMRSVLQYSNQMVMLAAYVLEKVTGMSWEDFVQTRILDPLGMENTIFKVADLATIENRSAGYVGTPDGPMEVPYLPLRGIAPAGGLNSSLPDMEKFVQFQLGDGSWNGEQLVSNEMMEQMHKVQMEGTPYFWRLEEIPEANYGLCWFVDEYKGKKMLSHGGNTLGFSALMTLIPEENLGIIALGNATSNFMIYPLTYGIIDDITGAEIQDWNATFMGALAPIMEGMAQGPAARAAAKVEGTTPSFDLSEAVGSYNHPTFGTIEITQTENGLTGKLNGYDMLINHYNYDEFDSILTLMGVPMPITFVVEDGNITGLQAVVEPNPAVNPVLFKKM